MASIVVDLNSVRIPVPKSFFAMNENAQEAHIQGYFDNNPELLLLVGIDGWEVEDDT